MTPTRVTAISGIAFVVLFAAGVAAMGDAFGNFGDSDATFVEYYRDDHPLDVLGAYLISLAGVAFLRFVVGVCGGAIADPEARIAAIFAMLCGVVFVALLATAVAAAATIPASRLYGEIFSDTGQIATDVSTLPQLGFVFLYLSGALFASASVASMALVMRHESALPAWVARFGFVAAALLLLSGPLFIPFFILPIWVLAASAAMLRAESRNAGHPTK